MTWRDRAIGIALGLVLGVVAVVLFVLLGSEDTIDAPSIDQRPPVQRETGPDGR